MRELLLFFVIILQIEKLRCREVRWLARGHPDKQSLSLDSVSGKALPDPLSCLPQGGCRSSQGTLEAKLWGQFSFKTALVFVP